MNAELNRLPMLWRRELWEHRSLWLAPLIASAVLLLLLTAGALQLTQVNLGPLQLGGKVEVTTPDAQVNVASDGKVDVTTLDAQVHVAPDGIVVNAKAEEDEEDEEVVVNLPGVMINSAAGGHRMPRIVPLSAMLSLVTTLLLGVGTFPVVGYLLESLYADRRDRSVLFWRSLPVSDTATVLAKYSLPMLVLLGIWVLGLPVSVLVVGLVKLSGAASFMQLDWTAAQWLQGQAQLLGLVVVGLLWYAPAAAWLLVASAWARRAPFAWALAPPLVLVVLESVLLGSKHLGALIGYRLHLPQPSAVLSWQLWLGVVVAAALVAVAIRLRRNADAA